MRPWKILCDFDGTVSIPDATDVLLERCAGAAWRDVERQWRAGVIGSRECMTRQVELIDASAPELYRVLDDIPIDPAFGRFVALARDIGVELTIVSDGLDRAIYRILDNHGLGSLTVLANHLVHVASRRWRMDSPHASPDCRVGSGTCKCALAGSGRESNVNVLLIGDGQSDVCVASRADFVFAKARLLDHCRQAQVVHRAIEGFGDAIQMLPDLLAGRLDHSIFPAPLPTLQPIEYA